jgi:hypothetical protein
MTELFDEVVPFVDEKQASANFNLGQPFFTLPSCDIFLLYNLRRFST